ncbi:hypothetical protein FQN54_005790 [Arachnomyces sp. PD_36]|nr:hypothetical protein FQN54_005790 [Arachnomyces sp. PD_36]
MAPGGRNFACPWDTCGKSFNRKSDLCRHYRIHTNERPYHCSFADCMKSFIQRSALTVHSRTHTGEKPHVCDHAGCHKAFSDSSSLARHRRIHTGKRPYKCHEPSCDRSFCRKTTLTKHQNRSHQAGSPQSQVTPVTPEHQYPPPIQVSIQPENHMPIHQQSQYPPQSMVTQGYFPPQTVAISQPIHIPSHTPRGPPLQTPTTLPYHHPQPQPQPQQNLEALRSMNYLSQFQPQVLGGIPQQNIPIAEGGPMMIYHEIDAFDKPGPRVFDHSQETDWTFLGVG